MSETLRVRVYNVRFGDAILVTVPEREAGKRESVVRHMLIDVGNVLSSEGGEDAVFKPVVDDILTVLGGRPLDLYVMTHEHLDHIQGLPHASMRLYPNGAFEQKFKVRYAWLTASAAEDYYDRFPNAKEKKLQADAAFHAIDAYLRGSTPAEGARFQAFWLNNNPARTGDCVKYLRVLAEKTTYVFRGCSLEGAHPFREATFRILAPEEDTSSYYGRFVPMTFGGISADGPAARADVAASLPPAGVDAGAFFNLVELRRRGVLENLLTIDRAANNTSVVFILEWRGWTLMFPGDAELRSWMTMKKYGVLTPVHFLKVSHHGSHNGTPPNEVLDLVIPERAAERPKRRAVISTYHSTYPGIPHTPTNKRLRARCELFSTLDDPRKPYIDFTFAARR